MGVKSDRQEENVVGKSRRHREHPFFSNMLDHFFLVLASFEKSARQDAFVTAKGRRRGGGAAWALAASPLLGRADV